jgi:hypothetical protein
MIGIILLVLAGELALVRYTDLLDPFIMTGFTFGSALVLMGLGLVVLGALGRRAGGFLAAAITITVLAAPLGLFADTMSLDSGRVSVGESTCSPHTKTQAEAGCSLTIGKLTADFSSLDLKPGERVDADVEIGIGQVTLLLPTDANVQVGANLGTGNIVALRLDESWKIDSNSGVTVVGHPDDLDNQSAENASGVKVRLDASRESETAKAPTLAIKLHGSAGQLVLAQSDKH